MYIPQKEMVLDKRVHSINLSHKIHYTEVISELVTEVEPSGLFKIPIWILLFTYFQKVLLIIV